ncbi:MAG: HIG1 domain-containing protein [Rickettsiales bacterium]|jgi:hypothetical protein|nr:HIG1 domain-containing protein [Rickettsiales bacterium]
MLATITLIFISLTFLVVIIGTFSMIKGGEFNRKYSNKLMQIRVSMQALSILLLFLTYMA